jgi:hypothetical protein
METVVCRQHTLRRSWCGFLIALALSLVLHASLLPSWWSKPKPPTHEAPLQLRLQVAPGVKSPPLKLQKATPRKAAPKIARSQTVSATPPNAIPEKLPASMPAPPAPTAEEWQLASNYTPRNSKRYRHTWGQQVRSMMGTAVEGADQGIVRFRIEIAPDGKIARVEELWSTSAAVSTRARKAIQNLPPLPPTPTGKPLVFEQTISFLPYETGWPPSYKLDCLPEPQPFNNPFAWNGASQPSVARQAHRPPPPEGCPPDSTEDTIEEEENAFKRQMDQWRWAR